MNNLLDRIKGIKKKWSEIGKFWKKLLFIDLILLAFLIPIKLYIRSPRILVNQVGYFPNAPKTVIIQSSWQFQDYNVKLIDSTTNEIVVDGIKLEYVGKLWQHHYYRGDFSEIQTTGVYKCQLKTSFFTVLSDPFKIDANIYDDALDQATLFFYYQRSNCEVQEIINGYPGHALDHMDDGVFENGTWRDLYGGWFSAGDYAKHIYWGAHIEGGVFGLLYAYEKNPSLYNTIDRYDFIGKKQPNGVPDILDEAMWGIAYLQKLIHPNGTIIGSFEGTLKMVAPEYDTDQIIGTADDRFISPAHPFSSFDEAMWFAAGFAKMVSISQSTGHYTANASSLHQKAKWIYANYSQYYDFNATGLYWNHGAPLLAASQELANLELAESTPNGTYQHNANWTANMMARTLEEQNEYSVWDDLGFCERGVGMVLEWAIANGSASNLAMANQLIEMRWEKIWQKFLADSLNVFQLPKIWNTDIKQAQFTYFKAKIGMNSLYLYLIYALSLSIMLKGNDIPALYGFQTSLMNWIHGVNPFQICMVENIGTHNLPAYHHRYMFIPDNPRGAVPGIVPNGYIEHNGRPYLDLETASVGSVNIHAISFESNEPWLPHNIAYLMAFSQVRFNSS